ncbi:MAG: hypothetical protein ACRDF7_03940 [Candidatus Limnocylindrales bacterium]
MRGVASTGREAHSSSTGRALSDARPERHKEMTRMSHHKPDEKKTPTDMTDVEGNRMRPRDKAIDLKDVEGNRMRPRDKASEMKDVEGNRMRPRVKTAETKDVEGHSFLIDPHSARQVSRDRSAELERAVRERARAKEARPNKQHQG